VQNDQIGPTPIQILDLLVPYKLGEMLDCSPDTRKASSGAHSIPRPRINPIYPTTNDNMGFKFHHS
jgi:hypothetical protein